MAASHCVKQESAVCLMGGDYKPAIWRDNRPGIGNFDGAADQACTICGYEIRLKNVFWAGKIL
ncbi:hypothetical protein D1BOALGB6SA_397 [Olavius sp. associated proteobacterium Delta 1]|nr:hypothetical protein D1BOALGB6SA_397 [Olavius sp. associated proteobacterium Delta 1]